MKTFSERVVEIAQSIPRGKVTTYGRIARAAGAGPMAAQSITSILWKAWKGDKKKIPFHRIVYANGKVWTDDSILVKRLALYKKEGIKVNKNGRIENFPDVLQEF